MTQKTVIYVDVDETFVRSVGTKRIPMTSVIKHILQLKEQGAVLYCWSSGGADYAPKRRRVWHCRLFRRFSS